MRGISALAGILLAGMTTSSPTSTPPMPVTHITVVCIATRPSTAARYPLTLTQRRRLALLYAYFKTLCLYICPSGERVNPSAYPTGRTATRMSRSILRAISNAAALRNIFYLANSCFEPPGWLQIQRMRDAGGGILPIQQRARSHDIKVRFRQSQYRSAVGCRCHSVIDLSRLQTLQHCGELI